VVYYTSLPGKFSKTDLEAGTYSINSLYREKKRAKTFEYVILRCVFVR